MGIGWLEGFHEPMKINVQANHSGVQYFIGQFNPSTTRNLKHIFGALVWPPVRPPILLFAFCFFISLRLATARSMSPRTTNSVHRYIITATALPRIPARSLSPLWYLYHTSTNHIGFSHRQICMEKGPWKDGTSAWKVNIVGIHRLEHKDMHFLIFFFCGHLLCVWR